MDLRRRFRSLGDGIDTGSLTVRNAFRVGSMATFWVLLVGLLAVSVAKSSPVLAAVVASVLLTQMLYVFFPKDRVRDRFNSLFTGEAGEDAYEAGVDATQQGKRSLKDRFL